MAPVLCVLAVCLCAAGAGCLDEGHALTAPSPPSTPLLDTAAPSGFVLPSPAPAPLSWGGSIIRKPRDKHDYNSTLVLLRLQCTLCYETAMYSAGRRDTNA